ncbi:uncharacterized protein LOC127264925 [Andrographis paniculata]|uniref:uncharacterized protein LOC127264925 n=1 Tax=Andrographis paniculata TaxID=175694 RepID=UPI0021E75D2F|nr:uncharacterized protein LOC127264925 [Andrographis paniculata]
MDPCPFVRLTVESMAIQLPASRTRPAGSGVHPSTTPCYANLNLQNFPPQTALLPVSTATAPESSTSAAATFHLRPDALRGLSRLNLKISVFSGRMGGHTCGIKGRRLLGFVHVCIDLGDAQTKACLHQTGWTKLGRTGGNAAASLHLTVRSEPDPRFVFQFGGEPECSPVVFQIQGNLRQPVFSCKFSADRNNRSRSLPCDFNNKGGGGRRWLRTFSGDKDRIGRERKGWMVVVYDLSGSAVAAASMTTPFVPSSPGSDRVSRSNPGAWLILRPSGPAPAASWKPWGRLEAWRERGPLDGLGYKFELVMGDGINRGIPIAEGNLSVSKGGKFRISGSNLHGFVMESSVEGEGRASKPSVEVGVQHVTCMGDAALFVAVAAAVDLSMDACRLFSQRLRKELVMGEGSELMFV